MMIITCLYLLAAFLLFLLLDTEGYTKKVTVAHLLEVAEFSHMQYLVVIP
jgi:hypothetical protein